METAITILENNIPFELKEKVESMFYNKTVPLKYAITRAMEEYSSKNSILFFEWLLENKYTKCSYYAGIYKDKWVKQGISNEEEFLTIKELYDKWRSCFPIFGEENNR